MSSFRAICGAILGALATSSCVGSPSGPAAELYRERPDIAAMALARGEPSVRGPEAIGPYLEYATTLLETRVESGDPLIDDASKLYAKLLREIVGIVRASKAVLDLYPDVGGFIAANWTLSPTELGAAARQFDSRSNALPIGPKLSAFRDAQKQIFDRNSEITRTFVHNTQNLLNPFSWFVSAISEISSVVEGTVSSLGLRQAASSVGVQWESNVTTCEPRSRRTCTTRPTIDYFSLRRRALKINSERRQAIADGNAYIRFLEQKLTAITAMGARVVIPDVNASLADITKRERYDYAFDVRAFQVNERPDVVWAVLVDELQGKGNEIIVKDSSLGLIVTDIGRQGFMASMFNAHRYYTQYYILLSPSPLSGGQQKTTEIEFKRFVYTGRLTEVLSPLSAVVVLKPTYERTLRAEKEEEFIETIRMVSGPG